MTGVIGLLVYVVVLGLIFWLAWWFLGQVGLPEPFNKVALVILALLALILLLNVLVGFIPVGPSWHWTR